MKLTKVVNLTDYDTRDLRRFVTLALKSLALTAGQRSNYYVRFRYQRRGGRTMGYGYYDAKWMEVLVPREPHRLSVVQIASTMRHERLHNAGFKHREFHDEAHYCRGDMASAGLDERWGWLWGFHIGQKRAPVKPTLDAIIERRHGHAVAMLARAKTREKRAVTFRAKWQARVRYYDRKRAAAKAAPDSVDTQPTNVGQ